MQNEPTCNGLNLSRQQNGEYQLQSLQVYPFDVILALLFSKV